MFSFVVCFSGFCLGGITWALIDKHKRIISWQTAYFTMWETLLDRKDWEAFEDIKRIKHLFFSDSGTPLLSFKELKDWNEKMLQRNKARLEPKPGIPVVWNTDSVN